VGESYGQDIRPAKQVGLIVVWLRNDAMSAPLPLDFDPTLADFEIHTLPELEALLP
jgi:FMN phosphatase YigB (HAD superfamily)